MLTIAVEISAFLDRYLAKGGRGRSWEVTRGGGRSWEVTRGRGRSREVTGGQGRSREVAGGKFTTSKLYEISNFV